jgi:hypothetical protein
VLIGEFALGLAGTWMLLTPLGMIGGATLATFLRLQRADQGLE